MKTATKALTSLLAGILMYLLASSCAPKQSGHTVITVSIAPEKFFVERIAGDKYTVNVLVPNDANPEMYDPTPRDIAAIAHSDLYFYMGSLPFEETWLTAISQQNTNIKCVDLSSALPEHKGHTCEHCTGHTHGDPHFWSSIVGAKAIAHSIYSTLVDTYPSDSVLFRENYQKFATEIAALEDECRQVFDTLEHRSFIIYHPSLSYFAEEWGLDQRPIEYEGKEPTPLYLSNLINQAKEDDVRLVFIQEEFDIKNAELVAKELGAKTVQIRPLDEDWMRQIRILVEAFASL